MYLNLDFDLWYIFPTKKERRVSLNCEICGADPEEIAILPIKRLGGSLNTIACIPCAVESGVYCVDHNRPHLGFEDDTSACKQCIDEEVLELGPQADLVAGRIEDALPEDQYRCLKSWADMSSVVSGDTPNVCIVRSVVTLSLRTGRGIRITVDEVVHTKRPDTLLPTGL